MLSCDCPPIDQGHQDFVWSDWQIVNTYANCVEDGVSHRTHGWDDRRFTDADYCFAFVVVVNDDHQFRNFCGARQLIISKSGIDLNPQTRIHDALFPEGHAERLNHAAVDLTLYCKAVERKSYVLHVNHLDWTNASSFNINLNFCEAGAAHTTRLELRLPFATRCDTGGRKRCACLLPGKGLAAAADITVYKRYLFRLDSSEQRGNFFGHSQAGLVGAILN